MSAKTKDDIQASENVIVQRWLNVRKDAGYDKKIIKVLPAGTELVIDKKKTVDGEKWGHCSDGWVCLTYCEKLNKINAYSNIKHP